MIPRWVAQYERCETCDQSGLDVDRCEAIVAKLPTAQVWRHPTCEHIQFYRSGGLGTLASVTSSFPVSSVSSG